jgi:DNA-binding transcriptional MerR regulator
VRSGRRRFTPQSLEKTLKQRKKLLRHFTNTAIVAATRSWRNHSHQVAVNRKGEKRTHHRARTAAENHRIRARQRRLQVTTLKSLALAELGKSSNPTWSGIARRA